MLQTLMLNTEKRLVGLTPGLIFNKSDHEKILFLASTVPTLISCQCPRQKKQVDTDH
jgi:hypothetical protein